MAILSLNCVSSHVATIRILHRDIKPEVRSMYAIMVSLVHHTFSCAMFLFALLSQNIGFDIRGDIKIFDFGLAKELKPIKQEGVDEYVTSGVTGTRRYMAPEVIQIKPYGKLCLCHPFFLEWSAINCIIQRLSCHRIERGCVLFRNNYVGNVVAEGSIQKIHAQHSLQVGCWRQAPKDF